MVSKVWDDEGFYLSNPERKELEWLEKDIH
jgi:hypothetical protein